MAIIGIDEVGRGPLAGPVVVCGVRLVDVEAFANLCLLYSLDTKQFKDSKKLSIAKREKWNKCILEASNKNILNISLIYKSAKDIDERGIANVIREAVAEVLMTLQAKPDEHIQLDGSLMAPTRYINQQTIIKGDEKVLEIALASIVAKVSRDNHMIQLAPQYPVYDFAKHKGYGTLAHRQAIIAHGLSPEHRRSFCNKVLPSTI